MTCTEQKYHHQDHITDVIVDWDEQTAEIRCTKFNVYWKVFKPRDQTAFFKIALSKGVLAPNLEGHWNGLQKAVDAVVKHCYDSKESQASKNDRLDRDRKERNAAKANTEGS